MTKQPITFLTYPRSGLTWLEWNIKKNTDLDGTFIHYHMGYYDHQAMNYPIITTVRNPIDCISSVSVQQEPHGIPANAWIKYFNKQYVEHYEFVLKNAKMFFTFDDVINNSDSVIKHICDEFGGLCINNDMKFENYTKWHEASQDPRKLVTSKNEKNYDSAKEYLSTLDLSRHWELYSEALLRCVKI